MTILEACLCAAVAGAVLLVVQWLLAVRFGRFLANRLPTAAPVQAPAPSLGQPIPAGAAAPVRPPCQCPMCRSSIQVTALATDQVAAIEKALAIVSAGHMRGMGIPLAAKLSADGVSADVHVMVLDGQLVRDVVLPAIKAATSPRTEHG